MVDVTSDSLQIINMSNGSNDNTWGDKLDQNDARLEQGIAGVVAISGLTGGSSTLSDDQNRNAVLVCTGTLASNQTLVVRSVEKWWHVINSTSGDYTLTLKTSAGSGVAIPQGGAAMVYCDGTDVLSILNSNVMSGMGTVTDNRLVRTNGTDGTSVQESGVTLDDNDDMSGINDLTVDNDLTVTGNALVAGFVGKAATSGATIPSGTTAQRAGTDIQVRGNTDLGQLEAYVGGEWKVLTPPAPILNGRLTPTSGTPVISADVSGATAVYFTPFHGNRIAIYDTSSALFVNEEFAELTLTLAAASHAANAIYDVFIINDSGTIRAVTGPAWVTTTPGSGDRSTGAGTTELELFEGIWVNKNALSAAKNGTTSYSVTAREGTYVGSIWIDGTAAQVSCDLNYGQACKFGIWNALNRRAIGLRAGDSTPSWTASASIGPLRGDSNNKASSFCGLAEEVITSRYNQKSALSLGAGSTSNFVHGIGFNSSSATSGSVGDSGLLVSTSAHFLTRTTNAEFIQNQAPVGVNEFYALEDANGSSADSLSGGEDNCLLTLTYMG